MKINYIVPAAGQASRLNGIPKFLLPINKKNYLLKFHIELIESSFAEKSVQIVIGTNKNNSQILKNLYPNLNILEFESNSMVETVIKSKKDIVEDESVFGCIMPDTYFSDVEIYSKMYKKIKDLDAVVAVWSINEDQIGKFGQCDIDSNDILTNVIDKNPECKLPFFWGSLMWKNSFNKFLELDDLHFGETLNRAINNGMKIGVVYAQGTYFDCGTFEEYRELLIKEIY